MLPSSGFSVTHWTGMPGKYFLFRRYYLLWPGLTLTVMEAFLCKQCHTVTPSGVVLLWSCFFFAFWFRLICCIAVTHHAMHLSRSESFYSGFPMPPNYPGPEGFPPKTQSEDKPKKKNRRPRKKAGKKGDALDMVSPLLPLSIDPLGL